ncbi:MAG: glycoside hydrolase family 43 protein [Labilibaculum antarcticum]
MQYICSIIILFVLSSFSPFPKSFYIDADSGCDCILSKRESLLVGSLEILQEVKEKTHVVSRPMVSENKITSKKKLPNKSDLKYNTFHPGELWLDDQGQHINAHGGGMLFYKGKYYWFGEHKSANTSRALVGVRCYSSKDLYNWRNEGVALSVEKKDTLSPITIGCTIERPKVIFNKQTKKFIMYFHLELKGQGYSAAQVGIATSNNSTGPYTFLKSLRPNKGEWSINMTRNERNSELNSSDFKEWWTPKWRVAIEDGLFVRRDFAGGQMSRDMTLFVDDDGKAYHIYSSEDNLTIHIAELTDDYLNYTGKYVRLFPGGHNEAPALFKKEGKYYLITSGCTGWAPNAARSAVASTIWGPWETLGNPCRGEGSELTFSSQSTYIFPVYGEKKTFVFMADRWNSKNLIDSRYVWLPVHFENERTVIEWEKEWKLRD